MGLVSGTDCGFNDHRAVRVQKKCPGTNAGKTQAICGSALQLRVRSSQTTLSLPTQELLRPYYY
eukprot:gene9444-biopygen5789